MIYNDISINSMYMLYFCFHISVQSEGSKQSSLQEVAKIESEDQAFGLGAAR